MRLPIRPIDGKYGEEQFAVAFRERVRFQNLNSTRYEAVKRADLLLDRNSQVVNLEVSERLPPQLMAAAHEARGVGRRWPPCRWVKLVKGSRLDDPIRHGSTLQLSAAGD